MARNLTTSTEKTISYFDPYSQPAFTVYGGVNSDGGYFTYNHRLELQARSLGSEGYGDYRHYASQAYTTEFNNQGSPSTTRWTSSNASSSNSNVCSMTCLAGYLGHSYFINATGSGNQTAWMRHTNGQQYAANAFRDNGILVNETHQHYAIFGNGANNSSTSFRVMPRNPQYYYSLGTGGNLTSTTIPLRNDSSYYTGYGNICYNKKTNQLLVMETNLSDSGNNYRGRPVVWNNVPDLRKISENMTPYYQNPEQYSAISSSSSSLQTWFDTTANRPTATTYGLMSGKPRTNGNEDYYRGVPVLCDNGRVVFYQMIPNGNPNAWITRWNSPSEASNPGACQGNLKQFSGTTSYGVDQGAEYGARWHVTSDGRYVAAYSPYYYYGSGMHICFIRVSDGKFLWSTTTDTSYGYTVAPIGKSSFIIVQSTNADSGQGLFTNLLNMDDIFAKFGDNADCSAFSRWDSYMLDTPYYSTNYPAIIPAVYDTSLFTSTLPN